MPGSDIAVSGTVARSRPDAGVTGGESRRDKGPVQILCEEVGFDFSRRLERTDVLVAFVRTLVAEVADMRELADRLSQYTGKAPSTGSAEVLALAEEMLTASPDELVHRAGAVHDACDRLNPEDTHPTDHLIDMLSSCASAIRFGLETPCRSRHAASAADHIWKHKYGVRLFDQSTPRWQKEWTRGKLLEAVISLLPPDALSLVEGRPQ
jgi:hypothetical protein